jgi:hypothetical protein
MTALVEGVVSNARQLNYFRGVLAYYRQHVGLAQPLDFA